MRKKDKQTDVVEIILQQILRKKRKPSASKREREKIFVTITAHSNVVVYADSNALELDKCSLDEIGFDNDQ